MKRIISLLFICFSILSFAQKTSLEKYNFIGKWKGTDKNKTGYIILEQDGTASISIGGKVLGGKDYVINGKKAYIIYKIEDTTMPVNLDFIMYLDGIEKTKRLLFILEIIDADSFKIASDFNDERPTGFAENNTMLMTRVKE